MAVENISRTPEVVIERCRFGGVPTRGVLVTTRGRVQIVDSVFDRIPMPSILVSCDAVEWWESGPVTDVVVAGNRFIEPGDSLVGIAPSASAVDVLHPIHGRVILRDNLVEATSDVTLVDARSVAEVRISGTVLPDGVEGRVVTEAVGVLDVEER
jgi:hypothetical protein